MDFLTETYVDDAEFKNQDYANQEIKGKEVRDSVFKGCSFASAALKDCTFRGCRFVGCDLSMVSVKNSQLSNVEFVGCKLIGINWTEAIWEKGGLFRAVDFDDCSLNYSTFFGLKLPKLKLIKCIAREVDFGEADLTEGVFSHTDFMGSIFMHTDLTKADFVHAVNYTIPVKDNVVKGAKFSLPEAIALLRHLDIELVDPDDKV